MCYTWRKSVTRPARSFPVLSRVKKKKKDKSGSDCHAVSHHSTAAVIIRNCCRKQREEMQACTFVLVERTPLLSFFFLTCRFMMTTTAETRLLAFSSYFRQHTHGTIWIQFFPSITNVLCKYMNHVKRSRNCNLHEMYDGTKLVEMAEGTLRRLRANQSKWLIL